VPSNDHGNMQIQVWNYVPMHAGSNVEPGGCGASREEEGECLGFAIWWCRGEREREGSGISCEGGRMGREWCGRVVAGRGDGQPLGGDKWAPSTWSTGRGGRAPRVEDRC
jgi:hypothetical protein